MPSQAHEEREKAKESDAAFTQDDMLQIRSMVRAAKRRATWAPQNMYEVDADLAKRVINEDSFVHGRKRISVGISGEAPVRDMMMPVPIEPSDGYAPSLPSARTPRSYDQLEIPPMVILLCEQDEGMGPNEVQAKLAHVFGVSPARFAVTVADA